MGCAFSEVCGLLTHWVFFVIIKCEEGSRRSSWLSLNVSFAPVTKRVLFLFRVLHDIIYWALLLLLSFYGFYTLTRRSLHHVALVFCWDSNVYHFLKSGWSAQRSPSRLKWLPSLTSRNLLTFVNSVLVLPAGDISVKCLCLFFVRSKISVLKWNIWSQSAFALHKLLPYMLYYFNTFYLN